ncbi:lysozyme [Cephus cinctus]|uniref:lysozyme n=1 Tax=Cephus cinctus TaxID=211228 RepID=A0AAJ7C0P3_CEPCN|nr:lysozyme [Cephus cinctus]
MRRCFLVALCCLSLAWDAESRVLSVCDAVRELQSARISRSLISNWVCLMQSESNLNTELVTGPKTASSYSYGIFQINSSRWCARGRRGGACNLKCEDLLNDDIQDDIGCAKKIFNTEGFKAWPGWMRQCKMKPLPSIANCRV